MANTRTGGQILVDQLRLHGVELCFGVPGESYLAVLDAFYDQEDLRYVICRQEGGVAMAAEAYGKLTGRPGIAFVTRGPGATNAASGVHVAQQDSTPLILFVGQIASATRERDAFQEVDYRQMFGGMAKWVAEIEEAARIPEFVHRAFMTATSGRPGPVVLALPEDMLLRRSEVVDARPWRRVESHPDPADLARLEAYLSRARRPFVILGGGGWTPEAVQAIRHFVEANDLPVACGFRRQDLLDNEHPLYMGDIAIGPNPDLVRRIKEADLVVAIGTRLSEMTTQGYALFDIPRPAQHFVHIHNDVAELGRVYEADLPIHATMPAIAAGLARLTVANRPWASLNAAQRASYLAWRDPRPGPGHVQMAEIVRYLRTTLPADAIVTNGAGNYCVWVNRGYSYRQFRSQLAPTSGSMGYGLPAALAAKLVHPDRAVVCFAGDGCFMMTGQELATAVQHEVALIVIVVNNGMYGTIRMHQEREFPTRVSGTDLCNPDFAALARAYGANGWTVTQTDDFAPAFEAALASGQPCLIELKLDPDALTPRASLSEIRAEALKAGR
ncbi:acetolactate synthase-1/2/3 large subunit [Arboricoccus pini]|uniref:Acetolactate synthase-1/2/3 large subunit n=1 Tax=Arboricoccus pini TaxID=1963835 RepID=A0A212QQ51_9PROT|nr:thiamine pyrophosphate-binding protein [Arboricoccus pini]SNB61401.1 acetolactate synthase-1/2/3 large subunit [Arboricoccus pini]